MLLCSRIDTGLCPRNFAAAAAVAAVKLFAKVELFAKKKLDLMSLRCGTWPKIWPNSCKPGNAFGFRFRFPLTKPKSETESVSWLTQIKFDPFPP